MGSVNQHVLATYAPAVFVFTRVACWQHAWQAAKPKLSSSCVRLVSSFSKAAEAVVCTGPEVQSDPQQADRLAGWSRLGWF